MEPQQGGWVWLVFQQTIGITYFFNKEQKTDSHDREEEETKISVCFFPGARAKPFLVFNHEGLFFLTFPVSLK